MNIRPVPHSFAAAVSLAALMIMTSLTARADNPPVPPAMPATPVQTAPLAPPPPQEFEGSAIVLDGGTLQLGEERLILFGIQVPAMAAPGGIKARLALDSLLGGDSRVHCVVAARDLQLHKFAVCRLGDIDLSEALLLAGVGTVDRYATRAKAADPQLAERYDQAESEARRTGNGLWAEFVKPPDAEKPLAPTFLQRLCRFLQAWQAGIGALVGFLLVGILLLITRPRAPAK
jgi:endonuclease YncB( thermonuclease family)